MNLLPPQPGCTFCPLHLDTPPSGHVGVPSEHIGLPPPAPALILLGQNPGYNEVTTNRPFVGKSGDLIRSVYLASIDAVSNYAVYLLNTARCGPNQPAASHYSTCFTSYSKPELLSILQTHADSRIAILLLGAPATIAFNRHMLSRSVNLKQALKDNGRSHTIDSVTFALFTTFHPAFILRQNSHIHAAEAHMRLVQSYLSDTMPTPSSPRIVPTRSPIT